MKKIAEKRQAMITKLIKNTGGKGGAAFLIHTQRPGFDFLRFPEILLLMLLRFIDGAA